MIEEQIEIRTEDGTADGFVFRPDATERYPGVIHMTDIGGIRPAFHDMARRLAGEGYTVLLPNVFYRTGKPPLWAFEMKFGDERTMKRFGELTAPLSLEAMERDAGAYVDFLAAHQGVSEGPMGVVGFCFTGKMALATAAARPDRIAAAASFHGAGLVTGDPSSPHHLLTRIKAHLLFGHAVEDRGMPAEAIATLDRALEAWGGARESDVYAGAHHGWTVPDRPVYHREQAERAYARLTALLASALK